jgi:hypothetical protein
MTETTMTDRTARNQENSQAAFLAQKTEFDALLAALIVSIRRGPSYPNEACHLILPSLLSVALRTGMANWKSSRA